MRPAQAQVVESDGKEVKMKMLDRPLKRLPCPLLHLQARLPEPLRLFAADA